MKSSAGHGQVNKNRLGVESDCETHTNFENIRDNEKGLCIYYKDTRKSAWYPLFSLLFHETKRVSVDLNG